MKESKDIRQLSLFELGKQSSAEPHSIDDRSPRLVKDIPFVEVGALPRFGEIEQYQLFSLSLTNDTSGLTHGLHRFPAKFIPQIPRWALEQFGSEEARVLDPFMGSGTTLVEGLLRKGTTIGIDIDPLAHLIAHAKTDTPSSDRIAELGAEIDRRWQGPVTQLIPPMPDVQNFSHWFSEDAWGKLQALLDIIQSIECTPAEKRFFLTIFSSILRWVSNADDQSQKTYVSGTNLKTPPEVLETFWRSFHRALRGLKQLEFATNPQAVIVIDETGDACSLGLEPESIDLIITSPPYLDSVDYMYNFMLEYFWLGNVLGVPDRETFNRLRRGTIGAKRPEQVPETMPEALADLVCLDDTPDYRRKATLAYFHNMSKHFTEAAHVMRSGARYVLVIGNSRTKKNIIPLHDCLVRLAATSGLELEKAFAYRVRRHYMKFPRKGRGGIILIDWIIVFHKVDRPVNDPPRLPLPWAKLNDEDVAN